MNFYKIDFDDIYLSKEYSFVDNKKEIAIENLIEEKIHGVNSYCSKEAHRFMSKEFDRLHMPAVTLLGSGNYHYIAYLLLKRISYPFTLILLDHHSDMQEGLFHNMLSCGNWLKRGLKKNIYLKQVIIFGLGEQQLPPLDFVTDKEIYVFTKHQLQKMEWKGKLLKLVKYPVYISIDKDVFDYNVAYTNWDQGTMTEDFIDDFFEAIDRKVTLIGGDICGEYPISYSNLANMKYQKRNMTLNKKLMEAFNQHRNLQ